MSDAGRALRDLAGLLRAGHPLRAAISIWPTTCPSTLEPDIAAFSRRVALGQDPSAAAATIGPLHLGPALELQRGTGANLATVMDSLADWHDDNVAFVRRARASSSGATLSARIVAGLPLLGLPLLPTARVPLFDATGIVSLGIGLVLMLVGLRWMGRLVPPPPDRPDLGIVVAIFVSAALAGGSTLHSALDAVARGHSGSAALVSARRRVRLGQTWAVSLRWTEDPGLADLASVIERAERSGAPTGSGLAEWAQARRDRLAAEFEASIGRAPVKMVVPLTICVLPAFGLLAIVPFLRGLAGA